ncbi:MAG TPA: hypothetical protein DIU35_14420 [Candidatus Latescibacteria bacterium]|nr:hypothetical protein [Gemmatimonadota bacterium]HCR18670.1 hypothetical protein [Candidatus Latescibacterota bacterium]
MRPQTTEEPLDLRESGKAVDGKPQLLDTRLYMQLHVFQGCADPTNLVAAAEGSGLECVIYSDLSNPTGIGFLTMSESPETFVSEARQFLNSEPFASLEPVPDLTMTGRTYATGFEPDLVDMLLSKPKRNTRSDQWPWAVWYPLRRKSEFGLLSEEETRKILGEHARIGRTYGQAGYAVDIRMACYGLDRNDNDFVIGLIGSELYPLSRVVQDMRKTQQTARYIESLGPFFVGRAIWQSPL